MNRMHAGGLAEALAWVAAGMKAGVSTTHPPPTTTTNKALPSLTSQCQSTTTTLTKPPPPQLAGLRQDRLTRLCEQRAG